MIECIQHHVFRDAVIYPLNHLSFSVISERLTHVKNLPKRNPKCV
jgi:hypothetical protein